MRLLFFLLIRVALATPPTSRPLADEALQARLSAAEWPAAEATLRLALARELEALRAPAPAPDWVPTLRAMEQSRQGGRWERDQQLRRLQEAIQVGDVFGATQAAERAADLGEVLEPRHALALFALRLRSLLFVIGPWLLGGLVAMAAGFLVELSASRATGTRQDTPLYNPYVTGRPLRDPELVFGREDTLRLLTHGLMEKRSFYLTGRRRIGKTTLLLQVGERNQKAGGVSVFADVAGTRGDQAREVIEKAIETATRGRSELSTLDPMARVHKLAADDHSIVLLMDEVDALNQATKGVRRFVRELSLEPHAPARLLAAGVGLDTERDPEARRWPALLQTVRIGPLSREASRDLLVKPVADQVEWSPEALDRIVEAAQGRPLLIQLYGHHIIHTLSRTKRRKVLPLDVDAVQGVVERAHVVIQDADLEGEMVPIDLPTARLELGQLWEEIQDLERQLEVKW